MSWPKYIATFSDGTTRKFVARHYYEAIDRAGKCAGANRTVKSVKEV